MIPLDVVEILLNEYRQTGIIPGRRSIARRFSLSDRMATKVAGIVEYLVKTKNYDKKIKIDAPKRQQDGNEKLIILVGDWHIGNIVNPENVMGINEFNNEIAFARVTKLIDDIGQIKEQNTFSEQLIILLGDFVEGIINDGSLITSVVDDIDYCTELLLILLSNIIDIPTKIVAVYGNHGRTTEKIVYPKKSQNFDKLIYKTLKRVLSKSIDFTISEDGVAYLDSMFINHGDNIRSQFSLPFYGFRKRVAYFHQIAQTKRLDFKYLILGHFHQFIHLFIDGVHVIGNGSLVGVTEFAFHNGLMAPAEHVAFSVDENNKLNKIFRINLQIGVDK